MRASLACWPSAHQPAVADCSSEATGGCRSPPSASARAWAASRRPPRCPPRSAGPAPPRARRSAAGPCRSPSGRCGPGPRRCRRSSRSSADAATWLRPSGSARRSMTRCVPAWSLAPPSGTRLLRRRSSHWPTRHRPPFDDGVGRYLGQASVVSDRVVHRHRQLNVARLRPGVHRSSIERRAIDRGLGFRRRPHGSACPRSRPTTEERVELLRRLPAVVVGRGRNGDRQQGTRRLRPASPARMRSCRDPPVHRILLTPLRRATLATGPMPRGTVVRIVQFLQPRCTVAVSAAMAPRSARRGAHCCLRARRRARRAASRTSWVTTASTGSPGRSVSDHRFLDRHPAQQVGDLGVVPPRSPRGGCRPRSGPRRPGVGGRRRTSTSSSRSATSSGRCTASRSASSPGRLGGPCRGRRVQRAAAPRPGPTGPRSHPRPVRGRPGGGRPGLPLAAAPSLSSRMPVLGDPTLAPALDLPGRLASSGLLEPLAHAGGLEPAAVGHLHHVLVAHEVVGVLGHRGQRGVGRLGPALPSTGRRQRRPGPPGTGGRAGPRPPPRQGSGSVRARSPGRCPTGGRPRPRRPRAGAPTRRPARWPTGRRCRRRRPARSACRSSAAA